MSSTLEYFSSGGLRCEGELFLPLAHTQKPFPLVVMGHGFGAERNFGTSEFINAFTATGCAVFAFDYRFYGGSEGQPRQLIDPALRLDDWRSALDYVRGLDVIDPARIALWGSSFGGGHVLSIAAEDHNIKAVIAQVPHCDSKAAAKNTPFSRSLQALSHALLDSFLSLFGGQHRIAIVGERGDGFSVLDYPGWREQYLKLANHSPQWVNSIPARSLLRGTQYSPIDSAEQIQCPVLIISGKHDQGVPAESVRQTADKIPDCQHLEYDMDHFDCYGGWELNNTIVEQQCRFLQTSLSCG